MGHLSIRGGLCVEDPLPYTHRNIGCELYSKVHIDPFMRGFKLDRTVIRFTSVLHNDWISICSRGRALEVLILDFNQVEEFKDSN